MCIDKEGENEAFAFEDVCYKNSTEKVILRITIDNKLNFDSHIRKMCKNSSQKLNALSRISIFLNKDQNYKVSFSCCPLIWMFSL